MAEKDRRKIVLGTKDVIPQRNEDIYLNIELSNSSNDELVREIIDNNFNLLDQFNRERETSLRFCVYGIIDSKTFDMDDTKLRVQTNHKDILYTPRKTVKPEPEVVGEAGGFGLLLETRLFVNPTVRTIETKDLSSDGSLSNNIFKKKKSSYFFLFELDRDFNNPGETKTLQLRINRINEGLFFEDEVPIIYYDADNQRVPFGTEIVDIDLNGDTQVIENDFPFFYDVHWVRFDLTPPRPSKVSFAVSPTNPTNALTVDESDGVAKFDVILESPSEFGIEEVDVVVVQDDTVRNPNEDYVLPTTRLKWEEGEQVKTVEIELVDDLFVENPETVVFGFDNFRMTEEGEVNTFILNIRDDDRPTPVGFEILSQELVEDDVTLNIRLTLEDPMPVYGQSIDVIIDEDETTAIIGEDFENMGTETEPFFRRTVNFVQGSNTQTFPIRLFNDLRYEFDKKLVLILDNPTPNVEINPGFSAHTINIKDSMVPLYTTYTISGDSQAGYGIFRMNGAVQSSTRRLSWSNDGNNDGFTNLFRYTIDVINKGEDIIYNDELISLDETVVSKNFTDGYLGFSVELPSNVNPDAQTRSFKNSRYQFVVSNIEPLLGNISPFNNSLFSKSRRFSDVGTQVQTLNAGQTGEYEYYLVSKMTKIKTRVKPGGLLQSEPECKNRIQAQAIDIEINGIALLNDAVTRETLGSTFNNGTSFDSAKFEEQLIKPFCPTGDTQAQDPDFVSNTLLLPFHYPARSNF